MTRLPGYCDSCGQFRYVQSDRQQLAIGARTGIYHGICSDCELREDRERDRDRAARGQ